MPASFQGGFDLQRFLATESEVLTWRSEGLPVDSLSRDNALVILRAPQPPFLIDPTSAATEWLKVSGRGEVVR